MDARGTRVVVPGVEDQDEAVMRSVRAIKAGTFGASHRERLLRCCADLIEHGAQAIIAGCTEIPLAIGQRDLDVPLIDPAQVLAEAVLKRTETTPG